MVYPAADQFNADADRFVRILNVMDADIRNLCESEDAHATPIDKRLHRRQSLGLDLDQKSELKSVLDQCTEYKLAAQRSRKECKLLQEQNVALNREMEAMREKNASMARMLALLTGKEDDLRLTTPLSDLRQARSQLMKSLRSINDTIDKKVKSLDTCVICQEVVGDNNLRSCRQQHLIVCTRCNMSKCPICHDQIIYKTTI